VTFSRYEEFPLTLWGEAELFSELAKDFHQAALEIDHENPTLEQIRSLDRVLWVGELGLDEFIEAFEEEAMVKGGDFDHYSIVPSPQTHSMIFADCKFQRSEIVFRSLANIAFVNCRFFATKLAFSGIPYPSFYKCELREVEIIGSDFNPNVFRDCCFVNVHGLTPQQEETLRLTGNYVGVADE